MLCNNACWRRYGNEMNSFTVTRSYVSAVTQWQRFNTFLKVDSIGFTST